MSGIVRNVNSPAGIHFHVPGTFATLESCPKCKFGTIDRSPQGWVCADCGASEIAAKTRPKHTLSPQLTAEFKHELKRLTSELDEVLRQQRQFDALVGLYPGENLRVSISPNADVWIPRQLVDKALCDYVKHLKASITRLKTRLGL